MKLPQISEAEYEVMKIIWKYAPISTNQVTDILCRTTDWSPKTVQTMLKRLVTKGVLSYEKRSRMFVYSPVFLKRITSARKIPVFWTGIIMESFLPCSPLFWTQKRFPGKNWNLFVNF